MSLIKLTDSRICPQCRRTDRISFEGHTTMRCPACGMWLFKHAQSCANLWNTEYLQSWYYHPQEGWIHSDHVVSGMKPNNADSKVNKPA